MAQQGWWHSVLGTLQAIRTSRQKCQNVAWAQKGTMKVQNSMGFFSTVVIWEANVPKRGSLFVKVVF